MAANAQGRKIAFIGASGNVGKPAVDALLRQGVHTITAIQRPESSSTFPAGVIVKKGDLSDESFLATVFQGQDALVLMPPLPQLVALQEPAIRAAAKAGVPYVFPAEYGPDPFASKLVDQLGLLAAKKGVRDQVEKLGVSSWISVAVGPWFDLILQHGFWGIDRKARKATLWRGAGGKVSTATIAHAGEALAAALSLPEADLAARKNGAIYAPSLHLTQQEILNGVQSATGTTDADWDIETRDVDDVRKEYEKKISGGDEQAEITKFIIAHCIEGDGGDFQHKVRADEMAKLEQLGLGRETLEEIVQRLDQ